MSDRTASSLKLSAVEGAVSAVMTGTSESYMGAFADVKIGRAKPFDATTSFADNDIRTSIPRFSPEARQANHALVDLIANIAERKGAPQYADTVVVGLLAPLLMTIGDLDQRGKRYR